MTIDKSKEITVPVWFISGIISVLISGFLAWGGIAAAKSTLARAQTDIENLRREKVDRNEFTIVMEKLNSIEKKIDQHIDK